MIHPRLLHSLVLIDPIFQRYLGPHAAFARLSTIRRDLWPSREAAASKFRSNKFYQQWDPRVLDKWIEYGLRDLPMEQYPDMPKDASVSDSPVTLSTTVAQEVYLYDQAYYKDDRLLQDDNYMQDVHPDDVDGTDMYRPESQQLYRQIDHFKPSVLYVFGSKSEASPPEYREDKLNRTGTGVGGSGGAARARVEAAVVDCGHLACFEKTAECADAIVPYLDKELTRWESQERERDEKWNKLSRKERVGINDRWKKALGIEERPESKRDGTKL